MTKHKDPQADRNWAMFTYARRLMHAGHWEVFRTKLDLTTFFLYLSKITSNLPENYLSRNKTTSEKSYSSKK